MNRYIMGIVNYDEFMKLDVYKNWWKNGLIEVWVCFYFERIFKNCFVLFFNVMILFIYWLFRYKYKKLILIYDIYFLEERIIIKIILKNFYFWCKNERENC